MEFSEELKTPLDKAYVRVKVTKENRDTEALKYILADERGRWFLMRLMERCHILDTTYPDSDHVERFLLQEGERRVALDIQSNIVEKARALDEKALAEKEYYRFMDSMANIIRAAKMDEDERRKRDGEIYD